MRVVRVIVLEDEIVGVGVVPQLHLLKQELATIILIALLLPLLFLIKQSNNNLYKVKQIY